MSTQPFLAAACLALAPLVASPVVTSQDADAAADALATAFAGEGIEFDLEAGRLSFPAEVCVRQDLLEYVLVAEYGAAHESLFATGVNASVLNTALVTLGAKQGENVRWVPKDPQPTEEEARNGAPTHDVLPPTGDGFLIYAAWREDGEVYFYRLEDLITNLVSERAMKRHAWVYLGSRMIEDEKGGQRLAAEVEGNLINLSYFRAGNTLFSAALDACVHQTIWLPNAALLPPRGASVRLVFSKQRLKSLPEALEAELPVVGATSGGGDDER
jgi:hypothetical protein